MSHGCRDLGIFNDEIQAFYHFVLTVIVQWTECTGPCPLHPEGVPDRSLLLVTTGQGKENAGIKIVKKQKLIVCVYGKTEPWKFQKSTKKQL